MIGFTWPRKDRKREWDETYLGKSPFKAEKFFEDIVLICQIERIIVLKVFLKVSNKELAHPSVLLPIEDLWREDMPLTLLLPPPLSHEALQPLQVDRIRMG